MTTSSFGRNLWLISLLLLIFLIPSNLFLVLTEQTGFVTGLRVDYLLPKLYLSDLISWIFIVLGFLLWKKNNSIKFFLDKIQTSLRNSWASKVLLITSLMLVMYQFLSPLPIVGGWFIFHLMTAALVGLSIAANKKYLNGLTICLSLLITAVFQAGLAAYQFITQSSLVGYRLLGEVTLSKPFGIAHASFNGVDKALAYGTTAHPNLLAGTVVLFTLIIIKWRKNLPQYYQPVIIISSLICAGAVLYFTQSLSALLALIIGLISIIIYQRMHPQKNWLLQKLSSFFTLKNKNIPAWFYILIVFILIAPILIIIASKLNPDNLSLQRRMWLNTAAAQIMIDHLALGAGLNQFTAAVGQSTANTEIVRFNQPAHHVGLLWLAETGLLGLIWLSSLIISLKHKIPWERLMIGLFALTPILVLDHYLLSLQTGRLLTAVFLTLITIEKTSHANWRTLFSS